MAKPKQHKKIADKFVYGEVDQHQQKREKILLSKTKDEELSSEEEFDNVSDDAESGDEQSDYESELMAHAMRAAARGVPQKLKDDDEEESDDDESDSEGTSTHNSATSSTAVNDDDDDDDEDEDESEEEAATSFKDPNAGFSSDEEMESAMLGKKKKKTDNENERSLAGWSKQEFYQQKGKARGNAKQMYETAMEEEENVKEVQKKKARRLKDADFEETFLPAKTATSASATPKAAAAATTAKTSSVRDESGLTDADKLQVVVQDSPELLEFLSDLQTKVSQIKDQVFPILSKVTSGQLSTQHGLSFMEVKFHILLSYCINIAFYMLLKAEGRPIKGHPVISQLVLLRTFMEKIKPIDEKLKFQVDNLITIATSKQVKDVAASSSAGSTSGAELQHRPNLEGMVAKTGAAKGKAGGEDTAAAAGAYVPPTVMPIEFDTKALKARKKELGKLEKRLQRSSMANSLRDVLGEEPEERYSIGAEHAKQNVTKEDRFAKELREYEEDTFSRKTLSKDQKKQMKHHSTKLVDELEQLDDFDDLIKMNTVMDKKQEPNRVTLLQYLDDLEGAKQHLNIESADADNTPFKQKTGSFNLSREHPAENANLKRKRDEDDGPEAKKKRLATRDKEDRKLNKIMKGKNKKDASSSGADSDKRAATPKMLKNRGLTPNRNKDKKNPRVKLKNKYAQKTAAANAVMARGNDRGASYSGEKSHDKGAIGSRKLG